MTMPLTDNYVPSNANDPLSEEQRARERAEFAQHIREIAERYHQTMTERRQTALDNASLELGADRHQYTAGAIDQAYLEAHRAYVDGARYATAGVVDLVNGFARTEIDESHYINAGIERAYFAVQDPATADFRHFDAGAPIPPTVPYRTIRARKIGNDEAWLEEPNWLSVDRYRLVQLWSESLLAVCRPLPVQSAMPGLVSFNVAHSRTNFYNVREPGLSIKVLFTNARGQQAVCGAQIEERIVRDTALLAHEYPIFAMRTLNAARRDWPGLAWEWQR